MFRYAHVLSAVIMIVFFMCLTSASAPVYAQGTAGSGGIVVDETAQMSIAQELLLRVQDSWPWYLTRASGMVAAIAMLLLMLSGIGFITGRTYTFLEPITGWATHRALGIILAVSIALHMVALYFDHFVPFSISDLLVPFASSYMPVKIFGISAGSLYVALGVLAFYVILLIVLISLIWVEGRTMMWKAIHLLSYMAMAFVFVHALYLGTDLAHGMLRWLWVALGTTVFVASLFRLWRAKTV